MATSRAKGLGRVKGERSFHSMGPDSPDSFSVYKKEIFILFY